MSFNLKRVTVLQEALFKYIIDLESKKTFLVCVLICKML